MIAPKASEKRVGLLRYSEFSTALTNRTPVNASATRAKKRSHKLSESVEEIAEFPKIGSQAADEMPSNK